jgi:methyl-accepting chemotaxis protein
LALYKRTTIVVNPSFQYKFSFIVCSLVFLCSLMYPISIYEIFDRFLELNPSKAQDLESSRNNLLFILFSAQLVFLSVVFFISILISHKIAGPIHKLKNYLQGIREGSPITTISFRQGDFFQDLSDEVSETMLQLQNERREDLEYLQEVSSYINNLSLVVPEDKKPVINEILSKLSKMRQRL